MRTLRQNGGAMRCLAEAFKHAKPVAAIGDGVELLREAPLNDVELSYNGLVDELRELVVPLASVRQLRLAVRIHAHTGTHGGVPFHCIDAAAAIDDVLLDVFAGPTVPVDVRDGGRDSPIGHAQPEALLMEALVERIRSTRGTRSLR